MWAILISLVVGVLIGISGFIPYKYMKLNSRFQQIGVILLLFSMGASIGANKELIQKLKSLGLISLVFSILTCLFSIIFTYFATSKFLKQNMEEDNR